MFVFYMYVSTGSMAWGLIFAKHASPSNITLQTERIIFSAMSTVCTRDNGDRLEIGGVYDVDCNKCTCQPSGSITCTDEPCGMYLKTAVMAAAGCHISVLLDCWLWRHLLSRARQNDPQKCPRSGRIFHQLVNGRRCLRGHCAFNPILR